MKILWWDKGGYCPGYEHHDIDPLASLTDILRRPPFHPAGQLDELLPDAWFASDPSARRKKAARAGVQT